MKYDLHYISGKCLHKTRLSCFSLRQCIAKCLQSRFCWMKVHHSVNRVPAESWLAPLFILGSLDPSGLLDIASLICSCLFSVVNVRQEWGRTRKSPSATWDMKKKRLHFGPNFLSSALQCERSRYARLSAFSLRLLSLHTFLWRLAHYASSKMNVSLNRLWHLSELQLYYRFQSCGDSLNGNYGGICFITEHIHRSDFSVYTTFLLCDQQEYINDVSRERSMYWFSITFCPAIILVSLSQSLLHLCLFIEVFMNNICHIASLSLKVTLVNYWSGQMITALTSVCSRLALGSVFISTLFLLVFLETLIWWITVYYYCRGSVGAFTETYNLQISPPQDCYVCFNKICKG